MSDWAMWIALGGLATIAIVFLAIVWLAANPGEIGECRDGKCSVYRSRSKDNG